MSEYNIQMNKYNALNAEYDQLYPQPMKHASTHAKDGSDPITPADIGAYTKGETDTLLQNKADVGHTHDDRYYTEAEVNSLLAAKQDAASAINTGNIASQSVNYANNANYANGAGNADTVDGWHMNLDSYGWGIKPICAGTGGMTTGSTGLSNGHVYLQFE